MRQNIIIVFSVFLIFSCISGPKHLSFEDALETGVQRLRNSLQEDAQLAILDFKSDNEILSSYIIGELYDKFINLGIIPMERSRIDTIALEVGYQLSGAVDDDEIIRIGHQLGAGFVVTGEIMFTGEAYRLLIFAIDIERGRRIASSSLNINRNDRSINHLISTRTITNIQIVEDSTNIRENGEVLSTAIQNLVNRIPRNSRILIADFIGTNEFHPQNIQSVISNEAIGISVITEEQRQSAINFRNEQNHGVAFGNLGDESWINVGNLAGADVIITGGVIGTGDYRRIVFRAINVETRQIISESCVLFRRNNTETINDVESLSQRVISGIYGKIRDGAPIAVINNIGMNRNADFVFDIIENNLVNLSRYRIVTLTQNIIDLIEKEIMFQMSGEASDGTVIGLGRSIGAQFIINIDFIDSKIQVRVFDVSQGMIILQETM